MIGKTVVIGLLIASAALFLLTGCEGSRGPQGPAGQSGPAQIVVNGSVRLPGYFYPNESLPSVYVGVSNSSSIPQVEINGLEIPLYYPPNSFMYDGFPIQAGGQANLTVHATGYDGSPLTAQASITLPGSFYVTSQDTALVNPVPYGSDITFTWLPSLAADVYEIFFSFSLAFTDSSGLPDNYYYHLDSLLSGNSLTIPGAVIFPPMQQGYTLLASHGGFDIWAISGPWQVGQSGNVTGDGIGYFYGWTHGGNVDLSVQSAPAPAFLPPEQIPSVEELTQKMVKRCAGWDL